MWYTFFVILHLIFVGIGIGITTLAIIGRVNRKKAEGTLAELIMIRGMAVNGKIMGSMAIIGLLVTGVVLTLMSYSFFPFSTLPWLALKQCVFIVLMGAAFTGTIPRGEKIFKTATAELGGPN